MASEVDVVKKKGRPKPTSSIQLAKVGADRNTHCSSLEENVVDVTDRLF